MPDNLQHLLQYAPFFTTVGAAKTPKFDLTRFTEVLLAGAVGVLVVWGMLTTLSSEVRELRSAVDKLGMSVGGMSEQVTALRIKVDKQWSRDEHHQWAAEHDRLDHEPLERAINRYLQERENP